MLGTRTVLLWIVGVMSLLPSTTGHAQVRCDRFDIAAKLDGHTLTVSLDTDLPDETTLMASIDRLYWKSGTEDAYSESYLSGRFTVGEWRQPWRIDVRDDVWQRALKERQQLLARIGEPFTVRRIANEVEVDFTARHTESHTLLMISNKPVPHTLVSLGINQVCDSVQLTPVLTRGHSRPAWPLEEEEVTTREAILKALEAAD